MFTTPWSEDEVATLREHYPRVGAFGLSAIIGRTESAIRREASRRGLRRNVRETITLAEAGLVAGDWDELRIDPAREAEVVIAATLRLWDGRLSVRAVLEAVGGGETIRRAFRRLRDRGAVVVSGGVARLFEDAVEEECVQC